MSGPPAAPIRRRTRKKKLIAIQPTRRLFPILTSTVLVIVIAWAAFHWLAHREGATKSPDLNSLQGYRIDIYYLQGNKSAAARGSALRDALHAAHSPAPVVLVPKPSSFFDDVGRPENYDDVRFEQSETAQRDALLALLKTVDPAHHYVAAEVDTPTPNMISIFLLDGF